MAEPTDRTHGHPRLPRDVFAALERAEPRLLDRLKSHGVIRVEWVVGFVEPYRVSAWLATATDAERDKLGRDQPFLTEVRDVVASEGLPSGRARVNATVAQSQETVDRDYEGSWFYALR